MTTLVSMDWLALAPVLAPALGMIAVLLVDAVAPKARLAALAIAAAALLLGFAAALPGAFGAIGSPVKTLCVADAEAACLWVAAPLASALQIGIHLTALGALLLLAPRLARAAAPGGLESPAVPVALVLTAASGAAAVVAAADFGSWLVGLELATVPTVALVALRDNRRSGGGALSLLLTSLLSFALLVVGIALWLTATGSATFQAASVAVAWHDPVTRAVLLAAVLLLLAGLGFKLSLVPFHAWTPQVFATAHVSIAALLATMSKLAGLGALLVVLTPFAQLGTVDATPVAVVVGTFAVVSMVLGTVQAMRQDDVLRLLAWSTIAQAGWAVLPLAVLSEVGTRAAAAYLITYAVASLLAFACVASLRHGADDRDPATRLTSYAGLMRDEPVIGAGLLLALLVFAGLPPGVIGLLTKVAVFRSLVDGGLWPLALAGVVAAVLGIAAYVRWAAVLFAPRRAGEAALVAPRRLGMRVVVLAAAAILAVLSVLPQLLFGLLS